MKKLLLIIAVFLFAANVQAQLRIGVKAGANFSKFTTNLDELKKSGTSWQVGLVPQFKIPLVGIGIQPELLYTVNKGNDNHIGYFNVPVNLRWQPLPLPLVKPIILVGPYFGYAVNFKGLNNIKDDINRFDWGIGLGAGVEIWRFQFEGRYSLGLQNLSAKDVVALQELKNKVFTLSVVYFFK
ncbi:MAG: PorT family protein [Prevotellaceae bacterium]|nr:PorT family protein [Prevotellaceae bacterium]